MPTASALGSVRAGSLISPATMFVCCHPPIVKSTATNAWATPRPSAGGAGAVAATAASGADALPRRTSPTTISAPSAAIFARVKTLAVIVPGLTPR